jgi:hypothetical protein
VQRVAAAILDELGPRTAYAIDGVGGGRVRVFSTFAVVDPASSPDLAVTSEAPGYEGSFLVGTEVPVGDWSVTNSGTATAQNVIVSVVVATDPSLASGVVHRVPLTSVALLAPRANLSGSEASIVLPVGMDPGVYFVGIRVNSNSETGIPEASYENNQRATQITVRSLPEPIGTLSDPSFEVSCLNCIPFIDPPFGGETFISAITIHLNFTGVTVPGGYIHRVTESGGSFAANIPIAPGLTGDVSYVDHTWFGGSSSELTQQTWRFTYVWPGGQSNEIVMVVPRGDMQ